MRQHIFRALTALAFACLVSMTAFAQADVSSSTVKGVVKDQQGASVPNATVTAKNLDLRKLAAGEDGEEVARAPWHFKLLMVLLVLYLGWRIVQLFT